jgi:hypothetical protein
LLPATVDAGAKGDFAGAIVLGPPSAFGDKWARRFPDPLVTFASGWMQVRARARQRGVELPLVISDHADWDELADTIKTVAPGEVWVTHGREEALVRWCAIHGIPARPLIWSAMKTRGIEPMNRFADLLDMLAFTPSRNAKLSLVAGAFPHGSRSRARLCACRHCPRSRHPRGQAGAAARTDRVAHGCGALRYSYDYVGDLAETIALAWPEKTRTVARAAMMRRVSPKWSRP